MMETLIPRSTDEEVHPLALSAKTEVGTDKPTAIGVVHTSPLVRKSLGDLLKRQPSIQLVGLFRAAAEVLEHPYPGDHVLLYDFETARRDGASLLMELRHRVPQAQLLMFNVFDDDQAIIECVRLGAAGCMLSDSSLDDLLSAIRSLASGIPPISPRVLTSLLNYVASLTIATTRPPLDGLTFRERQILELLAEGLSNKEVAKKLFLRPQTVRNYVHLIFRKLDVHSRWEAVRLLRAGKYQSTDTSLRAS